MTLRIGTLELASNVVLAPLAGFTDSAFRRTVRPLGGLGLATTELVSPRGLLRDAGRTRTIAHVAPDDAPLAVQFYGVEPDVMAEAARWAAAHGAAAIDINMGCPVRKITRHGAGAAILNHPDEVLALCKRLVNAVTVPVTAKMRLGPAPGELVAPELATRLRDAGCAAITIHGRYTVQKYSDPADLDGIRAVVQASAGIPVIGNGDIRAPEDARRMIEATGCAGVAIGRAALSNPWIFRDTHALLTTGRVPEPPSEQERVELVIKHFRLSIEANGERRACLQFRKWIPRYARKIPRLRAHRDLAQHLCTPAELENALL